MIDAFLYLVMWSPIVVATWSLLHSGRVLRNRLSSLRDQATSCLAPSGFNPSRKGA